MANAFEDPFKNDRFLSGEKFISSEKDMFSEIDSYDRNYDSRRGVRRIEEESGWITVMVKKESPYYQEEVSKLLAEGFYEHNSGEKNGIFIKRPGVKNRGIENNFNAAA